MANYRNRKLLDLAHLVPRCMNCNRSTPGGCEPAHANGARYGKGMSIKSHDVFAASLCHDCHAWLDQGPAPRAEKLEMWQEAFERTILYYFQQEWIGVYP